LSSIGVGGTNGEGETVRPPPSDQPKPQANDLY
jgi:hypothetical protein